MEQLNELDLNKLFCTFTTPLDLENTVNTINRRYAILFNKIFTLNNHTLFFFLRIDLKNY